MYKKPPRVTNEGKRGRTLHASVTVFKKMNVKMVISNFRDTTMDQILYWR